jgi:hypothetical protein
VFAALGAAIAVHLAAVGIAALKPPEPVADAATDLEQIAEVTFEQAPNPEPTPPPEEMEEPEPLDAPPEPTDPPEFQEEKANSSAEAADRISRNPSRRSRAAGCWAAGRSDVDVLGEGCGCQRPRPEYPYEARRSRATGSGVCVMTVDRVVAPSPVRSWRRAPAIRFSTARRRARSSAGDSNRVL